MAEVFYVKFGDYCRIAAEVLGTTPEQITRLPRIALADSALASPRAGFGNPDAYPTLIEKAAVLVEHREITRSPTETSVAPFSPLSASLRQMSCRSARQTQIPMCRWWRELPPVRLPQMRSSCG